MNAGPTPTPRPAPPTISANKMRTDPHRERRRGRAIHKCAPPAALHLPRRVLHLPTPQPPPPQRHGPARHSAAPTAYYPGRPTASPGARSISAISDFQKKRSYIRLISSYQGVSGSYQPNISSKTLYQALADISLIYQADTMVVWVRKERVVSTRICRHAMASHRWP